MALHLAQEILDIVCADLKPVAYENGCIIYSPNLDLLPWHPCNFVIGKESMVLQQDLLWGNMKLLVEDGSTRNPSPSSLKIAAIEALETLHSVEWIWCA